EVTGEGAHGEADDDREQRHEHEVDRYVTTMEEAAGDRRPGDARLRLFPHFPRLARAVGGKKDAADSSPGHRPGHRPGHGAWSPGLVTGPGHPAWSTGLVNRPGHGAPTPRPARRWLSPKGCRCGDGQ